MEVCGMSDSISRRTFLQQAGLTGASLALTPALLRAAEPADTQPTVVLALVGCAHIHTPGFVEKLKARGDVKVKWIWDHEAERAKKWADALGAQVTMKDAEVWADPEVRGVIVCSETNRHKDLVLAGAKARKHLFVEKPLGMTGAESREMADAISKAGVLFSTGYFSRTLPPFLFLKAQVDKGVFGKITRVRGSNCHSGSLGGWFDKEWRWMADPKIAGCGAFGDLGTHLLDILMWLFGDIETVTADIKVVTGRYGDCDESGEALIRFTSGVTGTLAAGWVDVADPVRLLISGTEGHATLFNDHVYLKSKNVQDADGAKPWTELPAAGTHPLDMFVDAVAGRTGLPLVPVAEAAARVGVMEAMYRAARERTWQKPL
jgi:predicted dehydrogenase